MPLVVTTPARHVTLVTVDNQPKRNAMSRDMLAEVADLCDELAPCATSWSARTAARW